MRARRACDQNSPGICRRCVAGEIVSAELRSSVTGKQGRETDLSQNSISTFSNKFALEINVLRLCFFDQNSGMHERMLNTDLVSFLVGVAAIQGRNSDSNTKTQDSLNGDKMSFAKAMPTRKRVA